MESGDEGKRQTGDNGDRGRRQHSEISHGQRAIEGCRNGKFSRLKRTGRMGRCGGTYRCRICDGTLLHCPFHDMTVVKACLSYSQRELGNYSFTLAQAKEYVSYREMTYY